VCCGVVGCKSLIRNERRMRALIEIIYGVIFDGELYRNESLHFAYMSLGFGRIWSLLVNSCRQRYCEHVPDT
jgi:hypothetical protein